MTGERCIHMGCGLEIIHNEGGDRWMHVCGNEDEGRWWPGHSTVAIHARKGVQVGRTNSNVHPATPPWAVGKVVHDAARRRWGITTQLAEMRLQEALDAAEADETKGLPRGATARAGG